MRPSRYGFRVPGKEVLFSSPLTCAFVWRPDEALPPSKRERAGSTAGPSVAGDEALILIMRRSLEAWLSGLAATLL